MGAAQGRTETEGAAAPGGTPGASSRDAAAARARWRAAWLPWTDRAGRVSALRAVAFAATVAPALWLLLRALAGDLGADAGAGAGLGAGLALPPDPGPTPWADGEPAAVGGLAPGPEAGPLAGLGADPIRQALHESGVWALRFLLAGLAVTPLARALGWPRLVGVRRMLGLAAFAWALGHLALHAASLGWDLGRFGAEILARPYLAVGAAAVLGLAALAATSFDAAIRRMGRAWHRLHRLVHAIAAAAILHVFLQSKLDVSRPALFAGVFAGLVLHRLALRRLPGLPAAVRVAGAAVLGGLATAAAEYLWLATMTGARAGRVLAANLDFSWEIRPMWLAMALLALPLAAMAARSRAGQATAARPRRR